MAHHVDAVFSQGMFRPLEPLALPEALAFILSFEEKRMQPRAAAAKFHSPKLAHPEDAADFVMEVPVPRSVPELD